MGHRRRRHYAHRRHARQAAAREARRGRDVYRDAARRRLSVQERSRRGRRMTFVVIAAALVVATAIATATIMHGRVRRVSAAVQDIVRDPARRMPIASLGGDLRELAEWINALAEDAQRSRDELAHERTLLASVADGLTQGVIAIDGERRIEM